MVISSGKVKYPAFSIYDEEKGHYETKLHPLMKILIVLEGIAIVLIAISGIVLYKLDWSLFGLPIAPGSCLQEPLLHLYST